MYTENDLNNLLAQLEKEFTPFLAKTEAEALLAKSEGGDKPPKKKDDDKPAEGAPPKADGPPAAAEGEAAEGEAEEAEGAAKVADAEGAEGVPPGAPAEGAPADPAAMAPGPDGVYDAEDMAHMAEMYGSMSPAELKAHHDAVRQALDAQGGAQPAGVPPGAPAPEAAPAAPAAPMDKCGEMMKSEKDIVIPVAQFELAKSELATKSAELEELKKSTEVMKQFITKLFDKKKAPAGKAITDLGVLEKSEPGKQEITLTKNEITKILTAKSNSPTLAKTDRNAISAYYTGGQVNLDSIRHLLK